MDLESICRLCCSTERKCAFTLFAPNDRKNLHKKLMFCVPIKVLQNDRLPKGLCEQCVCKLQICYDFIHQCLFTDKWLKERIQERVQEIEVKDESDDDLEIVWSKSETTPKKEVESDRRASVPSEKAVLTSPNIISQTAAGKETHEGNVTPLKMPPVVSSAMCGTSKTFVNTQQPLRNISITSPTSKADVNTQQPSTNMSSESRMSDSAQPLPSVTTVNETARGKISSTTDKINEGVQQITTNNGTHTAPPPNSAQLTMITFGVATADVPIHSTQPVTLASTDDVANVKSINADNMWVKVSNCYMCKMCFARFPDEAHVVEHCKIHAGEKPYKCKFCKATFRDRKTLKLHNSIHTGEKSYRCSVCHKSFRLSEHLKVHERVHSDDKLFTCPLCTKTFTQIALLEKHRCGQKREKKFKCATCGSAYTTKYMLTKHTKTHFSSSQTFACQICRKSFPDKTQLREHLLAHTAKTKTKIKCASNEEKLPSDGKETVSGSV